MLTKFWTPARLDQGISLRLLCQTTLPVIVVGVVLLAAGIYGAWRVHQLHKRGHDILAVNVSSIRAAEELETVALEMRYRLKRFLSTQNERHLDEVAQLLPPGHHWQEQTRKLAATAREQQLVERIGRGYQRLATEFQHLSEATSEADRQQMADFIADEIIPHRILDNTQKYIELNEEQLADSSRQNRSTANQLMFGLILLGTCGGVTGLIAGYVIARRVSRTLVQLSLPIRDTAGKLDQVVGPVSISADPSFKDLEAMLKTVAQRVATVVERLQANEREILRAEQLAAVGQLAAGLAHELRNPLTSLKTILQLAGSPSDLTQRDLAVLKQEMTRLESAVQSLLDFARPPQPTKRCVDLGMLIEQSVELVVRHAQHKEVLVVWQSPQSPLWVMADSSQMRQVILNLLVNALDAAPIGGIVELEATGDSDAPAVWKQSAGPTWQPQATLQVRDNGPGLPAKLGRRIFEPFVSTKEAGIGLGLSICSRIVEAHGGTITADNGPAQGAIFTVQVPLAIRSTENKETISAEIAHRG